MNLLNENNLKISAYTELVYDLKNKLLKNKEDRLALYKQKLKLNLALSANIISSKNWYYSLLELNKREDILNKDFCVINTSLYKLQNLD